MKIKKAYALSIRYMRAVLLVYLCLFTGGCALLNLPFKLLGGIFELLKRVPIPPPWVF